MNFIKLKKYFPIASAFFACSLCTNMHAQTKVTVTIDPSVKYQTIESFGASDCWSVKDIASLWSEEVNNRVVKELFSTNLDSKGTPEGIGLTMWRVNLGAGSDSDTDIDYSRRTESFLQSNGTYDWTKQAGQQKFMDMAREYGDIDFLLFPNSPDVQFTKNGKGYANKGETEANLKNESYADYANHCATVLKHFQDEGKGFKYFSPVNEPQYDWADPGQEGTPWQSNNIATLVRELNRAFIEKNVNTKLLIAEASSWKSLYGETGRASNQIYNFFDSNSSNYVGDLPSLEKAIGGHSYWTTNTNSETKTIRSAVNTKAKNYNLRVFQTEYSMLSGGEGIEEDLGLNSYMDNAVFLSKVIYSDLEITNVSSWAYWTAFGANQWSHNNRFFLIELIPEGGSYSPITQPGKTLASKNLWALGNYSRFIRPGYTRVRTKNADDMAGLMGTSFISPDNTKLVVVYTNISKESITVKPTFQNLGNYTPVKNIRYVTNSSYNLTKYGSVASEAYTEGKEFTLLPRSITTFVYELQNNSGVTDANSDKVNKKLSITPNHVRSGDNVTLKLNSNDITTEVSLFSLDSKLINSTKANFINGKVVYTVPDTTSGVYLVSVKSPTSLYTEKIIINNN